MLMAVDESFSFSPSLKAKRNIFFSYMKIQKNKLFPLLLLCSDLFKICIFPEYDLQFIKWQA